MPVRYPDAPPVAEMASGMHSVTADSKARAPARNPGKMRTTPQPDGTSVAWTRAVPEPQAYGLQFPQRRHLWVWFSLHRSAVVGAVALFALLFCLQGAVRQMPLPSNMDEFSVLLAADTFTHGRVTNPTHPMWVHFESLHVLMKPSYTSKYPPGPALFLALGERVFGTPIWGVWLSTVLACAAVTWMLMGWLPVRWAMLGGALAAVQSIVVAWSQFYLCCNLGVLGGALLLGAAKRLERRPRMRDAVLLALAMIVLGNTRPYEGAALSLAAIVWLMWRADRVALRRVMVPALGLLLAGAALMGYYNRRVTGAAWRLPYVEHLRQYDMAPSFWLQRPRHMPEYRHENLFLFHQWELDSYNDIRARDGAEILLKRPLILVWWVGDFVALATLAVLPVLRQRRLRPVLLLCAAFFTALLFPTWLNSNYISPGLPLYFLLLTLGLRRLSCLRLPGTSFPAGPLVVAALALAAFLLAIRDPHPIELNDSNYGYLRAQMIQDLKQQGGQHLVLVRYTTSHDKAEEWIYNDAEIDASAVVWAHDMGTAWNRELLDYYPARRVWLLNADARPLRLAPYTMPNELR